MNEDSPETTEDLPKESEDIPKVTEDFSSSSENVPILTDNVPNLTDDVPVENGVIAAEGEQNPTGNENQPKYIVESSTSDRVHSDEILATDEVSIIIDDDSIDNIEDISEASKSEETTGAIKIPTVGSVESGDDNTSYLSRSDVCSLSSWRETKGLPSLTTVSSFLEDESFSENMNEPIVDNNAQTGTTSVSSNDSHTSNTSYDFSISSPPRSASREQTVEGEMDSRNFMPENGSTTSSIRSGEPTDTDCEAFSESMSSISTTNSNEHFKTVDNLPKEYSDTQFEPSSSLDNQTVLDTKGKHGQTEVDEDQLSQVKSNTPPNTDSTVVLNGFPSKEDFQNNKTSADETDIYNSKNELNCSKDCQNDINGNCCNVGFTTDDVFAAGDIQTNPSKVNSNPAYEDVTDSGHWFQPTESVGKQSDSIGEQSEGIGEQSKSVGGQSGNGGAQLGSVGGQSENVGGQSENVGGQSENVGEQPENVGEQPDGIDPEPETGATNSESVETQKCTLCKENVAVDQLVTFPLDVAELIELKVLHCWRSGVCFAHPDAFIVVAYRPMSDSVVVEIAVSPNPLGRRLMTFVVDHLDILIKEWYPGLLTSYGAEKTVQKLIPCRSCEKDGNPKPHIFTFDSCVTQYSMGNFVKCPEHEVSIQDIAPDVVLHDIDADLLLQEDEVEYERSDANMLGKGKYGILLYGKHHFR
jgi:hypothetical protein